MLRFGRELQEYEVARTREYLLTADGDYCSSSLAGNTRKYHGLIVHGNRVLFSAVDEFLNGRRITVASYHGRAVCEGLKYLLAFSSSPVTFLYGMEGTILRKTISFDRTLTIRYEVTGEASLELVPLLADRGVHEAGGCPSLQAEIRGGEVHSGRIRMRAEGLEFELKPLLYYGAWYPADHERGYACQEDLFSPGRFHASGRNIRCALRARVEGVGPLLPEPPAPPSTRGMLMDAARSFLVRGNLIAGYHWFVEPWGRDAFVSLPGLLLEPRRFREAEDVFRFFAGRIRKGLVPNRVPENYRSSDASLWFISALQEYLNCGGRKEFLQEMRGALEEILSQYGESGVAELDRHLVAVAPQSTWMDTAWTPRPGKPVEVNALWISALRFGEEMGIGTTVPLREAEREFSRFWNPELRCLFDTIDPCDASIRPNQTIALARGLVDRARLGEALRTLEQHLLTPYGLRTLSPSDPGYRGRFSGDESYHNGCVWPWLTTSYVEARLLAGEDPGALLSLYDPILAHLSEAGLGTISELFDGDPPHRPGGCISQAWSVGEAIRGIALLDRLIRKGSGSPGKGSGRHETRGSPAGARST